MPEGARPLPPGLTTRAGQPLFGIPVREGRDEVVRYYTSDEEADQALAEDTTNIQRALSAIGAWAYLDDEDGPDMLDELDRMRHESKPTPPFEL
jgi:hypothetical protein